MLLVEKQLFSKDLREKMKPHFKIVPILSGYDIFLVQVFPPWLKREGRQCGR